MIHAGIPIAIRNGSNAPITWNSTVTESTNVCQPDFSPATKPLWCTAGFGLTFASGPSSVTVIVDSDVRSVSERICASSDSRSASRCVSSPSIDTICATDVA